MKVDKSEICKYVNAYNPSLKVGEQIGHGGTAYVFDLPGTIPPQVIKVMDTCCQEDTDKYRKKMRQYFINEIQTMQELKDCKYIMSVIDSYEYTEPESSDIPSRYRPDASVFLIRMKKMQPLKNYMQETELTEILLVQMAMDICKALQICEDKHILHRDVKPDNIFVSRKDGNIHFVLGDFGCCRRFYGIGISPVTKCGTEYFMAPEIESMSQLNSHNSDIYSLGATLYFLSNDGNFPSFYERDWNCKTEALKGYSDKFVDIIRKAVQIRPEDRYQHASQMLHDLEQLVASDKKKVIKEQYYLLAKQAMLKHDFDEAINYAQQGIQKGEPGSKRLLAYCLYHEYHYDERKVNEATALLDSLTNEGDRIAQCIRATIHQKNNEWDAFFAKMKESAEHGCIIAQYYYGRSLYEGWHGHCMDKDLGRYYVQSAAEADYLPALQFFKRILKNNPSATMPYYLQDDNLLTNKERLKSDIIKFL